MSSVLVTGGAGFLGSLVTRRLREAGHRVTVLDRFMYGGQALIGLWDDPDVRVVSGDLRDADARAASLDGVDAVIHLGAIVGDPACKRLSDEAWAVNYDATCALADEAAKGGVKRFVFASTCSNYGVSAPDALVDEDAPLNPISLYAESKVKAEIDLLNRVDADFDPVVLRLSTLYGVSPRMRFDLLVNDFTREAVVRNKIVIYGEQFWRPHLHVADAARAFQMMTEAPRDDDRPRVFNVGDASQNFQKQTIAELAVEAAPETKLEFVQKDEDPRSYRVNFDRIQKVMNFTLDRKVPDGVAEVRRLLVEKFLTDYDDGKYVN